MSGKSATLHQAGVVDSLESLDDWPADRGVAELIRELARRGALADRVASASTAQRNRLSGGAYEIVWPVVYQRLTRRVELSRGHVSCASSIYRLEPDCLDRFQDDVEAVLTDLLSHARVPIMNLEGWVASRLGPATVDAHRRRRGDRGALQRPRLPGWLIEALGHDRWLMALAIEVLVWVGVPATAGVNIWPLDAWVDRRAAVTGEPGGTDREVAREVEQVLAAMRKRPTWYANFVERPLGRKQAPVLPAARGGAEATRETPHLALTDRHEADDARLKELAALAVAGIEARIGRGEEQRSAVAAVLRIVFGSGTGAEDLDRTPGSGVDDERITALLADPAAIDRITNAVLELLPAPDRRAARPSARRGT